MPIKIRLILKYKKYYLFLLLYEIWRILFFLNLKKVLKYWRLSDSKEFKEKNI